MRHKIPRGSFRLTMTHMISSERAKLWGLWSGSRDGNSARVDHCDTIRWLWRGLGKLAILCSGEKTNSKTF
jgi:hypothetical protein